MIRLAHMVLLTVVLCGQAFADGPTTKSPLASTEALDAAPVKFLVRFEPTHPMAAAAERAARGDQAGAASAARRVLRSERALAGLCFEDFTLGGAEVVLYPCEPTSPARASSVGRQWAKHLRSVRGVAYVDQNALVKPVERRN
jgi:hypothetical protein